MAVVYLLQDGDNFKVGPAGDLGSRLKTHQQTEADGIGVEDDGSVLVPQPE